MRHPALAELPPAPPDRIGWPWTEGSQRSPEVTAGGSPWPRVTIVTPSFNQGRFIEETIRSVLLQGYPNLEYLIIDGGSTDGTVELIRKYEPWLTYWVSEPDGGQAHAINKGFRRCRGEIIAWLNSDDIYAPHAIQTAVHQMLSQDSPIVYGNCNLVEETGGVSGVIVPRRVTFDSLLRFWSGAISVPPQPAIFFRRRVLDEVRPLDESLRYMMDYDFWLRVAKRHSFCYVDSVMGSHRMHSESKTVSEDRNFRGERYRVSLRYGRAEGLRYRLSFWRSYSLFRLQIWRSRIWRTLQRYSWLRPLEDVILRVAGRGTEIRRRSRRAKQVE